MINLKEEHANENKKRGEEMMKKLMAKQASAGPGLPGSFVGKNKENMGMTPDKGN